MSPTPPDEVIARTELERQEREDDSRTDARIRAMRERQAEAAQLRVEAVKGDLVLLVDASGDVGWVCERKRGARYPPVAAADVMAEGGSGVLPTT
jgi:hypothetical protein